MRLDLVATGRLLVGNVAVPQNATAKSVLEAVGEHTGRRFALHLRGSVEDVMRCWHSRFADSKFVVPVEHLPATKHVAGTNFVQMTARDGGDRIVLICAIDNLAKGASGAAIQNMNVMFGLPETAGLA